MFQGIKKKLHIYQNIYLKHNYFIKKKSYAMDSEDVASIKYLSKKNNGFYVDVGANHPIKFSNTHLMYKNNWSGINLDINEFSIDLFNFMRPMDTNLHQAVSNINGEIEIYFQKPFSFLNTTDYDHAKIHFNNDFRKKKIKCNTLNFILSYSKYKEKEIDFLNIDVEGAELNILKGLNFIIYRPKVICIEILGFNKNDTKKEIKIKKNEVYIFLIKNDYRKVWSNPHFMSHIFINN